MKHNISGDIDTNNFSKVAQKNMDEMLDMLDAKVATGSTYEMDPVEESESGALKMLVMMMTRAKAQFSGNKMIIK